jgi:hypothetical protein
MKISSVLALAMALVLAFALLTSCSTLRGMSGVKTSQDSDKWAAEPAAAGQVEEDGWAEKYIPGWKSFTGLIPQPTDARRDWDRWMEKRNRQGFEGSPAF